MSMCYAPFVFVVRCIYILRIPIILIAVSKGKPLLQAQKPRLSVIPPEDRYSARGVFGSGRIEILGPRINNVMAHGL